MKVSTAEEARLIVERRRKADRRKAERKALERAKEEALRSAVNEEAAKREGDNWGFGKPR